MAAEAHPARRAGSRHPGGDGESTAAVWDRGSFLNRCLDDTRLAERIVRKFIAEVQPLAGQLTLAVVSRDGGEVARRSHLLKGTAANVSALALSETLAELEQAARGEDWRRVERLVGAVASRLQEFQAAVDEWLTVGVTP
jgi:HPt (histidine-containing phosphotransfer) domain-containing protein